MSNLEDPRVLLALERTLLAWNRSSLALIAFGFLIEKSTLLIHLIDPVRYHDKILFNRWLGVLVIVLGLIIRLLAKIKKRSTFCLFFIHIKKSCSTIIST